MNLKKCLNYLSNTAIVLSIVALMNIIQIASAGTVETGVITNECNKYFIDFEDAPHQTDEYGIYEIPSGYKSGIQFNSWWFADNTGPLGSFKPTWMINGDKAAWAPFTGEGSIYFTDGTATYFSLLASVSDPGIALEAYDAGDNLIDRAPATGVINSNVNTGLMDKLTVSGPNIAYVKIVGPDDGISPAVYIDDICIDDPVMSIPEFPTFWMPIFLIIGLMPIIHRYKSHNHIS